MDNQKPPTDQELESISAGFRVDEQMERLAKLKSSEVAELSAIQRMQVTRYLAGRAAHHELEMRRKLRQATA